MNSAKFKLVLVLSIFALIYGCAISTSSKVAFDVLDPNGSILEKETGEFAFPSVLKNTKITQEFSIENTGDSIVRLDASPAVEISGTGATAFTVVEQPIITIKKNEIATFKIEFAPTDSKSFEATVSISNNARSLNPFEFTIKGIALEPGLNVKQDASYIPNGVGSFDFGKVRVSTPSSIMIFTIENSGTNDLSLTGSPKIEITGNDKSMFPLTQTSVTSPIAPMGSTTFTIVFSPTSLGLKTATVSFNNDDSNKNPYTFTVSGKGVAPEINVVQVNNDIPSGTGSYDFGSIDVGDKSLDVTFIVENKGSDDLNLTGTPAIGIIGNDSIMFNVMQTMVKSTVAPAGSTVFSIKFVPMSTGFKMATISIDNDDSNENPYTFEIKGTGVSPEINVRQESTDIPSGYGIYNFGTVALNKVSPEITFKIENLGNAELKLTGAPKIEITGAHAAMFTIDQTMTQSPINSYGSTTFTVKFSPTTKGRKSAEISIDNDDPNENPYTFKVIGTTTKFDFDGDNLEDVVVGALYDDDGGSSSGCATIFLGSATPTSPLDASNADVKLVGNNIGDCFGVSVSVAGDVNGDGYDDIIVGANEDDDGGNSSGCAFIFFGSMHPPTKLHASGADVKLIGEEPNDNFGISVSNAGDVNNDGFDDVIVGADNNSNGGSKAGCAYIFYGKPNLDKEIDASYANVFLTGANPSDYFGNIVSNAGDINDDGYDDVVVVAEQFHDTAKIVGSAFVFFGSSNFQSANASNADVAILGEKPNSLFGCSISGLEDLNDDGFDDIVIGAKEDNTGGAGSGSAYVFYGGSNLQTKLYASNANVKLIGDDPGDYFGRSVSCAGDVDGDGTNDLIVGADGCDTGGSFAGTAYIFYGRSNLSSTINASSADVKLIGEDSYDEFGWSVSSAGDMNDDGFNDVIVGAIGASDGGSTSGNAYIFWGSAGLSPTIDASNADLKIIGEDSADGFGCSLSGGK